LAGIAVACTTVDAQIASKPDPEVATALLITQLKPGEDADRTERLRSALERTVLGPVRLESLHTRTLSTAEAVEGVRHAIAKQPRVLIVANNMTLARMAMDATATVPILFRGAADPVLMCLAKSRQAPASNATGLTMHLPAEAKMAEALLDTYPEIRRIIVPIQGNVQPPAACGETTPVPVGNPIACRRGRLSLAEADRLLSSRALAHWADGRGVEIRFEAVCSIDDLDIATKPTKTSTRTGVVLPLQLLFQQKQAEVVRVMSRHEVPAVYPRRSFVDAGGLMALVPRLPSVDQDPLPAMALELIAGQSPTTMPIRSPDSFSLIFNTGTAATLPVPPSRITLRRTSEFVP
jgi:putative ABC transport system substrate-binding protein